MNAAPPIPPNGPPPEVIGAAFGAVLEFDSANAQVRHNVEVLPRSTGKSIEGASDRVCAGGSA